MPWWYLRPQILSRGSAIGELGTRSKKAGKRGRLLIHKRKKKILCDRIRNFNKFLFFWQYKILQKRKTTSNKCNIGGFTAQVLTDERIRMLEDELGFDWSPNLHTWYVDNDSFDFNWIVLVIVDSYESFRCILNSYNDRKWRKMLDELRKYRDMHGHTNTHLTKDPFYSQLHRYVCLST